jgi:hypothetical protein
MKKKLGYNKIKFIEVNTFNGLNNLQRVDLFNNGCISEDYNSEKKLEMMVKDIKDHCTGEIFVSSCDDENKLLRLQLAEKQHEIVG